MLRCRDLRSAWLAVALIPLVTGLSGCALFQLPDPQGEGMPGVGLGTGSTAPHAWEKEGQWSGAPGASRGAAAEASGARRDPSFVSSRNGQRGFGGTAVRDAFARAGFDDFDAVAETALAPSTTPSRPETGYINGYRPKQSWADGVGSRWERLQERLGAGFSVLLPLLIGLLAGALALWMFRRFGQVAAATLAGLLLGATVVFFGAGIGLLSALACLAGLAIAIFIALGRRSSSLPRKIGDVHPSQPPLRPSSPRRGAGVRRAAGPTRRQGPPR